MSALFTSDNCQLICHKTAVDNIYKPNTIDSPSEKHFVLKSDLFRISSKYFRENQNKDDDDGPTSISSRRSKINRKKKQIQIDNNLELHSLVSVFFHFKFYLIIIITIPSDSRNLHCDIRFYSTMPLKTFFTWTIGTRQ